MLLEPLKGVFYCRFMVLVQCESRPVESHSGTRETILAGPYHNLIQTETSCHLLSARGQGRGLEPGGCIVAMAGPPNVVGLGKTNPLLPFDGPM